MIYAPDNTTWVQNTFIFIFTKLKKILLDKSSHNIQFLVLTPEWLPKTYDSRCSKERERERVMERWQDKIGERERERREVRKYIK